MEADRWAYEGKIQEYTEGEANQGIDSVSFCIVYTI